MQGLKPKQYSQYVEMCVISVAQKRTVLQNKINCENAKWRFSLI